MLNTRVSARPLLMGIQRVRHAVQESRFGRRPLECLYVEVHDGALWLYGADNLRLCRVRIPLTLDEAHDEGSFMLHRAYIPVVVAALNAMALTSIVHLAEDDDPGYVSFADSNIRISVPMDEAEPIDYKKALQNIEDGEPIFRQALDARFVRDAAAGRGKVILTSWGPLRATRFHDEEAGVTEWVMPMRETTAADMPKAMG